MKRVEFDLHGGEIGALARPGEIVTVEAENIEGGKITGVLVDIIEIDPERPTHHIRLVCKDSEAKKVRGR
jgi:hypothetical protein